MPNTDPKVDIGENANETEHRLENILGSKLKVKDDDIKNLKKIKGMPNDNNPNSKEKLREKYQNHFTNKLRGLSPSDDKIKHKMINHFAESEFDINNIKNGLILDQNMVYDSLESRIIQLKEMFDNFETINDIDLNKLRGFIKSLIKETGPNQESSLLLLNLIGPSQDDYFSTHSLNVCILTIIISIEVSKIMLQKALTPEISNDFYKSQSCSMKTFNENELVDLGLTSILHDIYIKQKFKNLKVNQSIKFRDQLDYKRHSLESYHMVEGLNLNRDVQLGILQHHERLDGKGYPDGIHDNIINRYARVLALADYYENLSFANPFIPFVGPVNAINRILKYDKSGFDGDMIIGLLKSTSLYPLGSFVSLNSGEIGLVITIDNETMQRPKVRILFSKNGIQVKNPIDVDLNEHPDLKINKAIHPKEVKSVLSTVKSQLGLTK